jgi:hypothetical protein
MKLFNIIGGSIAIISISLLLLTSCPQPYTPTPTVDNGHTSEAIDNLFVKDPGTGEITFTTNDTQYWSSRGYTLWTVGTGKENTTFSTRTVSLSKTSGCNLANNGWYGIVFCHGNRANYGLTMLTCMINTQGQYLLGEVIDAKYTNLSGGSTAALQKGYGVPNTIKLDYLASQAEFVFSVNGSEVCRFSDDVEPIHTTGNDGYIVVISSADEFPTTPVTVLFKELP